MLDPASLPAKITSLERLYVNKQEMFNKVWLGLQGQGWKKSILHGQCKYRGPNGTKCAAGHLIPDDKYDPIFESCLVGDLHSKYSIFTEVDSDEILFISRMQNIHDYCDDMRAKFVSFSKKEGLTIPTTEET
jgi:hypothetical protein